MGVSLHHVRNQTQVLILRSKYLYPLSNLTNLSDPPPSFLQL